MIRIGTGRLSNPFKRTGSVDRIDKLCAFPSKNTLARSLLKVLGMLVGAVDEVQARIGFDDVGKLMNLQCERGRLESCRKFKRIVYCSWAALKRLDF